ncbi:hypothetical protein [Marinobacterium sp. xm-d-530]|uniref:hypothetical protein n=1 Tax=Marinobacterium sp. xm-d-530 TaxID=2497747 RepID=UPI0015696DCF|nr:hypothetical protein [Marinobacterium sp. xm-d-530]NRQ00928.1 hypothetical protein [Marinobacterium sp. xm-d-530]
MRLLALLTFLTFTTTSYADCAFDQDVCEASCKLRFITNDAEKAGCISRCVAERTLCSAKIGAGKAKEFGEEALEESKSFIEGFTADQAKDLGKKAWENTKLFIGGMIDKPKNESTD